MLDPETQLHIFMCLFLICSSHCMYKWMCCVQYNLKSKISVNYTQGKDVNPPV